MSRRTVFVPEYKSGDWLGVFSTEAKAFSALVERCGDDRMHDDHWIVEMPIDGDTAVRSREVSGYEIRAAARLQPLARKGRKGR